MTTETATVEEKVKQPAREFGFTLMVGAEGQIDITPHNLQNDFEFVGLVEYVNEKKHELLKSLGQTLELRTLHAVTRLTDALVEATTPKE